MSETESVQANYLRQQEAAAVPAPVTCLGRQFSDEEARRAFFRARLAEHLADPDFRAIEGFPVGEDAAILLLSDPPYYTACPNPFLGEIVAEWQAGRADLHAALGLAEGEYHREPFAADVSEGKNDPIYNAHSYHTKVPHKAIMRYILHYTEPGDIVFDGFCGSGMTGVAAQLCGDRKAVQELGYTVDGAGNIFDGGARVSRLGPRKAVLNDLSPAATFIAYNYNTPVDVAAFEREARRILGEVEAELGWMYETWHPHCDDPNRVKARINYTIWSEVFTCPHCENEVIYWDAAVDQEKAEVRDRFNCSWCGVQLDKRTSARTTESFYSQVTGAPALRHKHQPVLIHYSVGNRTFKKTLDDFDRDIIAKIEQANIPFEYPTTKMMFKDGAWGEQWRQGYHEHISRVDQFFTWRNLWAMTAIWDRIAACPAQIQNTLKFCFTGSLRAITLLASIAFSYYFRGGGGPINSGTKGTLYISSTIPEVYPLKTFQSRVDTLAKLYKQSRSNYLRKSNTAITTESSTHISSIPFESLDYVLMLRSVVLRV